MEGECPPPNEPSACMHACTQPTKYKSASSEQAIIHTWFWASLSFYPVIFGGQARTCIPTGKWRGWTSWTLAKQAVRKGYKTGTLHCLIIGHHHKLCYTEFHWPAITTDSWHTHVHSKNTGKLYGLSTPQPGTQYQEQQ